MEFRFDGRKICVNVPDATTLGNELAGRFLAKQGFALATLNLDHLDKLHDEPAFVSDYSEQDLIVADGWPIAWMSRIARRPVQLIPGSDLVLPIARLAARHDVSVALVGSTEDALEDAEYILRKKAPGLSVVSRISPPFRFDPTSTQARDILADLRDQNVGLCFVALGAPKQEKFAALGRKIAPQTGFVSVGAGLDFLGGHQIRAPRIVKKVGMEWMWRAFSDPVRLFPRYARCIALLPREVLAARALGKSGVTYIRSTPDGVSLFDPSRTG